MKFIDLFSGLGGFHLAASALGNKCVFACEIDPLLRATYEKNFGIAPAADINDVDPLSVPEHDLLCAGFPCQPFSKAGEQAGWADAKRGTVFNKVVEILRAKKPKYLILENVAHFVKHDEGNTYARVRSALEDLGYQVKPGQLSPHQFGVPQIRERMYMVGRLDGELDKFEFPEAETSGADLSIQSVLDKKPKEALKIGPRVISSMEVWQDFLKKFTGR
ncbi:MAG: DNA (cytosine-5-)-methyltransferase [Chthoniobacteraceae bacterium]